MKKTELMARAAEQIPEIQAKSNGDIQITASPKAMKIAKYAAIGLGGILLVEVVPGLMIGALALVSNVLLIGVGATVLGAGVLLIKNKDIRRGMKYYLKAKAKFVAENVFKVSPVEMAGFLIESKKESCENIKNQLANLRGVQARIQEAKKINKEKLEEKANLMIEAQNANELDLAGDLAIQIASIDESNSLLELNEEKINTTLELLNDIEDTSKYRLNRSINQFEQLKLNTELVDFTYNALKSSSDVIDADENNSEYVKAIEELRKDTAVKISRIGEFSQSASPFVRETKLERIVQNKKALEIAQKIVNKQLPQMASTGTGEKAPEIKLTEEILQN